MLDQRRGLFVKRLQPRSNRFGAIISALIKFGSALVANPCDARRVKLQMIRRFANGTDQPAREPFDQRRIGHVNINDRVERAPNPDEHLFERASLRLRSREPVQNKSFATAETRQSFFDHGVGHVIRSQFTAIDIRPRHFAEPRRAFQMIAKQLAGSDVARRQFRRQALGLRAFA
jgi:hypothetical protein